MKGVNLFLLLGLVLSLGLHVFEPFWTKQPEPKPVPIANLSSYILVARLENGTLAKIPQGMTIYILAGETMEILGFTNE